MEQQEYNWDNVTFYLKEGTQGGLMMAILEADKMLMAILKDLGYPKDGQEQIKINLAKKIFSDFNRLKKARHFSKKIRQRINFSMEPKLAEEILAVYYQALTDIKEHRQPEFGWQEKLMILVLNLKMKIKIIAKIIVLGFVSFFILVFLLDKTKIGQDVVIFILNIENFIFSWFLILFFLVVGALALMIWSIRYFKGRKRVSFK